jgi:acyl carrier protein
MAEDQVLTDLADVVATTVGVDPGRVTADTRLDEDLGVDSLTLVDVVVAIEDRFGLVIPDDDWSRFHTVADIAAQLGQAATLRR